MHDCRLPPMCKWDRHSSAMLRWVDRCLFTDASGQPICPILEGQARTWESLTLGERSIVCPETSVIIYRCALRNVAKERSSQIVDINANTSPCLVKPDIKQRACKIASPCRWPYCKISVQHCPGSFQRLWQPLTWIREPEAPISPSPPPSNPRLCFLDLDPGYAAKSFGLLTYWDLKLIGWDEGVMNET